MTKEQKSSILRQLSTEERNQLLVFAENCYDRESEICDEKGRDVLFKYVETILAQAMLEEAKWWAAYCVFLAPDPEKHPTHHPVSEIVHMKDCNCEWHKRIAALQAALKGTSSRP